METKGFFFIFLPIWRLLTIQYGPVIEEEKNVFNIGTLQQSGQHLN